MDGSGWEERRGGEAGRGKCDQNVIYERIINKRIKKSNTKI